MSSAVTRTGPPPVVGRVCAEIPSSDDTSLDRAKPPDERIDPMRPERAQETAAPGRGAAPLLARLRWVDEHAGHLHHEGETHVSDDSRVEQLLHLERAGVKRKLVVDRACTTPARSAVASISRASRVSRAIGFSQITCLPAAVPQRVFAVQCWRRGHAHDVHVVARYEIVNGVDRGGNAGLLGRRASARRVRRANGRHLVSRGPEAGDLHARAEPRPYDPHPQRHAAQYEDRWGSPRCSMRTARK